MSMDEFTDDQLRAIRDGGGFSGGDAIMCRQRLAAALLAAREERQVTNGPVIIRASRPQGCDLCGKVAELRPYGPHGEWVCFECGMKDEEACKRAFNARFEPDGMKDIGRVERGAKPLSPA